MGRNYPETVRLFAVNDKNWRREVLLHGPPRFRNIKSQFHAALPRSSIVTKLRSMAEKKFVEYWGGEEIFHPVVIYVFEIRWKSIWNKYIYKYIESSRESIGLEKWNNEALVNFIEYKSYSYRITVSEN